MLIYYSNEAQVPLESGQDSDKRAIDQEKKTIWMIL